MVLVKKHAGEVFSKFKCRGFHATSLSTYDFSTLYTTLPHNLDKEKLLDLIELTFKRALKSMVHLFNVWFKALLREGLSEPESYGDLVYKFKSLKGKNDFFQFENILYITKGI